MHSMAAGVTRITLQHTTVLAGPAVRVWVHNQGMLVKLVKLAGWQFLNTLPHCCATLLAGCAPTYALSVQTLPQQGDASAS
jgi:hypothetical protein